MFTSFLCEKAIRIIFFLLCLQAAGSGVHAQNGKGLLKGVVTDGINHQKLFGVQISEVGKVYTISTDPGGKYLLRLSKGVKNISFHLKGYQTRIVEGIKMSDNETVLLDIFLLPLSSQGVLGKNRRGLKDSLNVADSLSRQSVKKELSSAIYAATASGMAGSIQVVSPSGSVPAGEDNAADLLKKLNGVAIRNFQTPLSPVEFNINGRGDRYNQFLMNGAVISGAELYSKKFALDAIPSEMIEDVTLSTTAFASQPADQTGGTISINTKALPDRNFLSFTGGLSAYQNTLGNPFYNDQKSGSRFLSLTGKSSNLPGGFPTTRSFAALNQYNQQEQIFYSKQLRNNLAPVNYGRSGPNDKLSVYFGKIKRFKNGSRAGLTGFISQQKSEQILSSVVQVSANPGGNPFPFTDLTKVLVRSQATDTSYTYASQLSVGLNGTIAYGKNKISLRNLFSSQYINKYIRRTDLSSPDVDPFARTGILFKPEQRKFINLQLSGEHALGINSRLKMDWIASYNWYHQLNPDERNFMLRNDTSAVNSYEIGSRLGAANDVTGNGRNWRDLTEYSYTGSFNISFPFNMFKRPQVLSGGVSINNRYRIFRNDFLVTKGQGFYSLEDMLSPDRYYPGGTGLSVTNYFSNNPVTGIALNLNDRGNYSASANLGAVYLQLNNRISNRLTIRWGIRTESNSQLVSSVYYAYPAGYQYAQLNTLDQNLTVAKFSLLPSARLTYGIKKLTVQAAAYRTLNRPQLEELSLYRFYDAASFIIRTGNQQLRSTYIQNYNAGLSWANSARSTLSVNAFYKIIDQPIEYILSTYGQGTMIAKPYNLPTSTVKGITAGFNLNLVKEKSLNSLAINFFANGTYTDAMVEEGPVKSTVTPFIRSHTLSGIATFTGNGGLVFERRKCPSLTVLYNYTGDHIMNVGSGLLVNLANGNTISAVPDYRVKQAGQLDIRATQKLAGGKVTITGGVNNVLNEQYTIYQDLNGNKKMDDPLLLGSFNGNQGYYRSGTDNTIINLETQRIYYLTISLLLR